MKTIHYLFLFIASSLLFSCGKISPKGNIETKIVEVSDFSAVDLQGKFRVFYVKDPKTRIELETYPNLMDNLDISVSDHVLKIHEKRGVKGVDFYNLTLYSQKDIQHISISDSVEFNGSLEIKAEDFKLKINKSAKFIGAIRTKKALVEMNNHALANIKGFSDEATFKLTDSASIIAPFWKVEILDLQANKNSYAEIGVDQEIKGNLLNNAQLLYYNSPALTIKKDKTTKVKNKIQP